MLYAFRCERDQRNKEVSKQCSVRKYYRLAVFPATDYSERP